MNQSTKKNFIFTSEFVSKGHPDKIADQISDAVLDIILRIFGKLKIAIETLIINNKVKIAGEVSRFFSDDDLDLIESEIYKFISNLEFFKKSQRKKIDIELILNLQSNDINSLVDNSYIDKNSDEKNDLGAGDQGMMFGFACIDTEEFMPAPIFYAKMILNNVLDIFYDDERFTGKLGPDAKSQVTIEYKDGKPFQIQKILLSIQHPEYANLENLRQFITCKVRASLPDALISSQTEILINPAGKFVIGGPDADTGVTGRKIIVDTYGGFAPHGGGAFSGKDPTKVDRSAAYMARYIAKNLVASGVCEKCLVQIAYVIGMRSPFSFWIDTYNTLSPELSPNLTDLSLALKISEIIDLSPSGIIKKLDLWNICFSDLSKNGHFGDTNYSWEKLDLKDTFLNLFFNKSSHLKGNLKVCNEESSFFFG